MQNIYYFYVLFAADNPERIRYVGVTSKTIPIRFSQHKYNALHEDHRSMPVSKWMYSVYKKGGEVKYQEIDSCPESEWEDREKYWVAYYRERFPDLLNLQSGGAGVVTKNMRNASGRQRSIDAHKKPIAAYDLEGNELFRFNSLKEAADHFNVKSTTIHNAVDGFKKNGQPRKAIGYVWKYLEKEEIEYAPKYKNSGYNERVTVNQYDIAGNLICTYPSMRAVMRAMCPGSRASGDRLAKEVLDKGKLWKECYWCTGKLITNDALNYKVCVVDSNDKVLYKFKTYKEAADHYGRQPDSIVSHIASCKPMYDGTYVMNIKDVKI